MPVGLTFKGQALPCKKGFMANDLPGCRGYAYASNTSFFNLESISRSVFQKMAKMVALRRFDYMSKHTNFDLLLAFIGLFVRGLCQKLNFYIYINTPTCSI